LQGIRHLTILVKAGTQPHGVREPEATQVYLKPPVLYRQTLPRKNRTQARMAEHSTGKVVSSFRIEPEE
jgi:hypothetical protein